MPLQDKVLMRKIKNREKKKIKSMKSKQENTLEEESEYIALLFHRLLFYWEELFSDLSKHPCCWIVV